ncbi:glycoside-pentoside-hexuronide (GPH):cation symporter [Salinicoccus sesuvii]|uniref:Glycoside-pentoside-hexuronide (GPH):cation symporter n=1 Tax=Salinicoccus sesuvii TaxID=868281 RepID=A0ABV7N5Q0_9STAP
MEENIRMSTKSEIIRYAFGGLGSNIPFLLILAYLMFYLTDVVGISPIAVGGLFLIARIIDAVTDPMMGMIADQTRSKFGKFRPYVIFGAPVLGIVTIALFNVPDMSSNMQVTYIYVIYILYSLISTVVNIPYHSLTPVLSEDGNQRTTIATAKTFMSVPATLIINVMVLPMVAIFGGGQQGWTTTSIILGITLTISFWVCASSAKRHDVSAKHDDQNLKPQFSLKEQISLIGKNKPLLMIMIAMCTNLIATSAVGAIALYYFTYNLGRADLFPLQSLVAIPFTVLAFISLPYLARKIGKRNVFLYGSILAILPLLVILFTPYEFIWIIFAAAVLTTALGPFTGNIAWAMLPDCVDYAEWKTGVRGDGVVTSSLTFINKLGTALGGLLGGVLLGVSGYVANQVQSPETLQSIVIIYALLPIGGHIFTIIALKFYKLDNQFHKQIITELKERKRALRAATE